MDAMAEVSRSRTIDARRAQAFPTLAAAEVERMRRFGTVHRYADGESLFETGKPAPGMFVVLAGGIRVTGRDGHGHDVPIVEHGPGQFAGEVGQLRGGRSFVDGVARGEVEALLIPHERLRALLIAEADLGERIMRALILRRVGLIEAGAGGPVLIGASSSPDVVRLRSFLSRNGVPHLVLDPAIEIDARTFIDAHPVAAEEMPLVVCPDGSLLRNPTDSGLARCIGMLDGIDGDDEYDVAIVGAGPAGLAAAVYAASEGLSSVVIEARAFGGQAGASARIENYLGFPTGISGQALAARAYTQAQKFGARMVIPADVTRLACVDAGERAPFELEVDGAKTVRSRAVVIATGARYRRPECANLKAMEGRGVWYWASPIEARMVAGQEVVLVGGGNSAGQAAVYLSGHASKVWMLVRGPGLAASMSKYLIDRIAGIPNIELRTRTEIAGLTGSRHSGVESVRWRHRDTGVVESHDVRNVFMFLGADPMTDWLRECGVDLDDKGFIVTGSDGVETQATGANGRQALEASVPGVFAIGDVRAGSVKRVGAAIGEGAAVIAQIHAFLEERRQPADVRSARMTR